MKRTIGIAALTIAFAAVATQATAQQWQPGSFWANQDPAVVQWNMLLNVGANQDEATVAMQIANRFGLNPMNVLSYFRMTGNWDIVIANAANASQFSAFDPQFTNGVTFPTNGRPTEFTNGMGPAFTNGIGLPMNRMAPVFTNGLGIPMNLYAPVFTRGVVIPQNVIIPGFTNGIGVLAPNVRIVQPINPMFGMNDRILFFGPTPNLNPFVPWTGQAGIGFNAQPNWRFQDGVFVR